MQVKGEGKDVLLLDLGITTQNMLLYLVQAHQFTVSSLQAALCMTLPFTVPWKME